MFYAIQNKWMGSDLSVSIAQAKGYLIHIKKLLVLYLLKSRGTEEKNGAADHLRRTPITTWVKSEISLRPSLTWGCRTVACDPN